ncbi:MAG: sugar transferase [Flavobacteriaceae bacterium]
MLGSYTINAEDRKVLLLLGDALMITGVLLLSLSQAQLMGLDLFAMLIGVFTYVFVGYFFNFFQPNVEHKGSLVIANSLLKKIIGFLLTFALVLFFFDFAIKRIPWFYVMLLTPLTIGLWRYFLGSLFRIHPKTRNVLYLHDPKGAPDFKEDIALINGKNKETFYRVKDHYATDNYPAMIKDLSGSFDDRIDTWILHLNPNSTLPSELEDFLIEAIMKGKNMLSFTCFYERTYQAFPVKAFERHFFDTLKFKEQTTTFGQKAFILTLNFSLSLFIGFIFLLSLPVVVLGNLFFNRGPLFYTQKRVGKHGKEFSLYKFRSMVPDAEKAGAKMATKNDVRVTPFGKILRIFRIDELPQVISVLRGDMQFIGPRPERPVFVDQLNHLIPLYNVRHLTKPGITGWAQVKYKYGENLEDSRKKLEYDLYYIKNRSIALDLKIIVKTIFTVLFSRGI